MSNKKYSTFQIKRSENDNDVLKTISYFFENKRKETIASVTLDILNRNKGGLVFSLWVDKKYRKYGLATRLMTQLVNENCTMNLKLMPIDEEEIGIDLKKFYSKFGFKESKIEEDWMVREVTPQVSDFFDDPVNRILY